MAGKGPSQVVFNFKYHSTWNDNGVQTLPHLLIRCLLCAKDFHINLSQFILKTSPCHPYPWLCMRGYRGELDTFPEQPGPIGGSDAFTAWSICNQTRFPSRFHKTSRPALSHSPWQWKSQAEGCSQGPQAASRVLSFSLKLND